MLGIIVCLIFSAFFSGSETALTSLSASKTRQLVEEEGRTGLKLWLEQPYQLMTALLIGNNIVNITASALATSVANRTLSGTAHEGFAIPAAIGAMTLLLLTFGEITPKAVGKRAHLAIAPISIRLLRPIHAVFHYTYVTRMFGFLTRTVMRWLGNDPDDQSPFVTYEEIEYLISLGSREGTFEEDKERLLRGIVDFPATLVKEIMVPRTDMTAAPHTIGLDPLLTLVSQCGHSRIPIYEESLDDIKGVFYVKELISLLAADTPAEDFNVTAHLRPCFFIPETKRIADLLTEFQGNRMHMAIVVDEFGGTAGLITLEDIIEEIFGDIQDEYDAEPEQITVIAQDVVRADARVSIADIEEYFGVDFPDDDYESLGGFILSEMGSVPSPGETFGWNGMIFRIMEADEKRIISVEVERVSEADVDDADLTAAS